MDVSPQPSFDNRLLCGTADAQRSLLKGCLQPEAGDRAAAGNYAAIAVDRGRGSDGSYWARSGRACCRWPANPVTIHQCVQALAASVSGVAGEVGVTRDGQDAAVDQDLLHLQQIDPGFDQVLGVAVAQGRNLFF